MRRIAAAIVLLLAGLPAATRAQYEAPVDPPPPAAQLAELIELYDSVCLRAFPDDEAAARELESRHAAPMSDAEVRTILYDDPGRGWNLAGRTARFRITIEAPPFHACGIRTLTVAGFPDMGPYRALAERYERGGGYRAFPPQSMVVGNVRTSGAGEQRETAGAAEALMVFLTTPEGAGRDPAHSAVEVRFVHQFARN